MQTRQHKMCFLDGNADPTRMSRNDLPFEALAGWLITVTKLTVRNAGGFVVTNRYIAIVYNRTQITYIYNNDSNEPRYK